jgi:LPXTG-site transpeptidase (sortase) family protein
MIFRVVGNLFVVLGLAGLAYLAIATSGVLRPAQEPASIPVRLPMPAPADPLADRTAGVQAEQPVALAPAITHVRIPRLQIDSEVVPSQFVQVDDSGTWEVPAFKVGHAEFTASAGQIGNAVLFGHVTSRTLGNVFQNLERARAGDLVEISSAVEDFAYRVVEVRRVPRTDVSVVEPTDKPSASLITCVGLWLPHLNDYAERLVVRAELIG